MPRQNNLNLTAEILSVRAGFRPAGLAEIPARQLHSIEEYFMRHGVAHASITEEQMHLKRLGRGMRPSGDRAPGAVMVYFGKDEETVAKLLDLDIRDESAEMGLLLGYPPCCVEYYQRLKNDRKTHRSWKSFFKYAPHEPCSLHCRATIAMEARLAGLMREIMSGGQAAEPPIGADDEMPAALIS